MNHFVLWPWHQMLQILAWGNQFLKINRVSFSPSQKDYLIKKRIPGSEILIAIANLLFRFHNPQVQILRNSEWFQWERRVGEILGRPPIQRLKRGLLVPKLAGQTLNQVLQQPEISEQEKYHWLGLATRSLLDLHQKSFPIGHASVFLSHADATVCNVMVNREKNEVQWFDFDLRHDVKAAALERHADDLRALILSATICCQWNDLNELLAVARQNYAHPEVWKVLKGRFSVSHFSYDLFHLAQLRRVKYSAADGAQMDELVSKLLCSDGCLMNPDTLD
jgi:hypothetical protein